MIVTPGQDTALVIKNALLGGRAGGAASALGVASGQALWTLAASAGVTAVLLASERAFLLLKLLGAAYLILLGLQALRAALKGHGAAMEAATAVPRSRTSPFGAYRQGVISNLGNPKMAVFFTSLLPQFAPAGEGSFVALLLLGLLFCTLTLVWLTAYAAAVARAGNLLRRPQARGVVDALTGCVLVALGLRLAVERR